MPTVKARRHYQIAVDSPHVLSVKEYGSATGIPVIFLHGGPGSGCRAETLCQLFDLKRFRVFAPDQRGAGESRPKSELKLNTTQHLIEDIELIRQQAGVEKWLVVGGSWGALLAVAYAQRHPQSVSAMVIRSLFLGSGEELERAFVTMPKTFYPELYNAFIGLLSESERVNPVSAYCQRILHSDADISLPATYVWHDYERALSVLDPDLPVLPKTFAEWKNLARPHPFTPRMEAHYFSNQCFLKANQLINGADKLMKIPGIIIQSRYDLLCPPICAYQLSKRWHKSEMIFVDAAGHSQAETSVAQAMIKAINTLAIR